MTGKLILYNILCPFGFLLFIPRFIPNLFKRGGIEFAILERFGIYSKQRKRELRALQKPVLIHAVSVGEVMAACTLIERWRESDEQISFVLSVTTPSGHALAKKKAPSNVCVIYSPLDVFFIVQRVLTLIQPGLLVIFEVEIWPNLICLSHRRGTPSVLANGRLSDRSASGYRKHAWFFRPLFEHFSLLCVQTEEDRNRAKAIVGESSSVPIHVCNTMKFDQRAALNAESREDVLDRVFENRPRTILTAASTHPGEEEEILEVYKELKEHHPELKLILVPRHHERAPEIEQLLLNYSFTYTKFVNAKSEEQAAGEQDILLVNTTGELVNFYAVSDVVFVGKTLAGNTGGHNIIEPALFGVPILHGLHMENFRLVTAIFKEENASIEVRDRSELREATENLLASPEERKNQGERARHTAENNSGAVDATLTHINELVTDS